MGILKTVFIILHNNRVKLWHPSASSHDGTNNDTWHQCIQAAIISLFLFNKYLQKVHDALQKKKVRSTQSSEKERQTEWDREVWCARLRASVSCRGLQMALRIKSKLCWLPRNGLCDTLGATGEGGKTGAEGGGWRRRLQPQSENRLQMSFWNI